MRWRTVPPAQSPVPLRALANGVLASLAPSDAPARALTRALASRLSVDSLTLTDSGTSALRLALEAAAARAPGRPVALPAWSCYDLVSAALGARVPVVFYDLDPLTLAPEPSSVALACAADPCAYVLVHPFGLPVTAEAFAGCRGARIDDCAQAWGAQLGGRSLGADGDAVILSFSRGKGISGGSGGAVAWRGLRQDVAATVSGRGTRDVLVSAAARVLSVPSLFAIPSRIPQLGLGETHFRPPREVEGISVAAAAIVGAAMEASDAAARARATIASRWVASSAQWSDVRCVVPRADATPGWLRFPVLAQDAADREVIVGALRPAGAARSYPRALPAVFAEHGGTRVAASPCPGADALASRLFTLPTHAGVRDADVAMVDAVLRTRASARSR